MYEIEFSVNLWLVMFEYLEVINEKEDILKLLFLVIEKIVNLYLIKKDNNG